MQLSIDQLLPLFSRERLAGVPLCARSRQRLVELASRLAAHQQLTVDSLRRYVPCVLAPFAGDWERSSSQFEALLAELEQTPSRQAGSKRTLRNRLSRYLAVAVAVVIAVYLLSSLVPRKADESVPVAIANIISTYMGGAEAGSGLVDPNISNQERALLDVAAGTPSAREAAVRFPELYWMPAAAESAGWTPNLPMPLTRPEFVSRIVAYNRQNGHGLPDGTPGAVEAKLVAAAAKAPAAELTRNLDAWCGGRNGSASIPLLQNLAQSEAARGRSLSDLGLRFSQIMSAGSCDVIPEWQGEDGSIKTLARAMAVASYGEAWQIAVIDRTWDPPLPDTVAQAPSGLSRQMLAAMVLLAGLIACGVLAWRRRFLFSHRGGSASKNVGRMPLIDPAPEMLGRFWAAPWLRSLGHSHDHAAGRLDVTKSVRATVKAVGFLSLAYRRRPSRSSYLVAVEQKSGSDAFGKWWNRVFETLAGSGVNLRVVAFRSSGALTNLRARIIESLNKFAAGARIGVLVLADIRASSLVPLESDPRLRRTTLTTISPTASIDQRTAMHRTARTATITEQDLEILAGYAEAPPEAVRYLFDPSYHWLDESPISEQEWGRLQAALRFYLGPAGVQWLYACALFPYASEPIAWHINTVLDRSESSAVEIAPRLFALPWFRFGFFPMHLRERFLAALEPGDAAAIRRNFVESIEIGSAHSDPADVPRISNAPTADDDLDDPLLMKTLLVAAKAPAFFSRQFDWRVRPAIAPRWRDRLQDLRLYAILAASLLLSWAILIFMPTLQVDPLDAVLANTNLLLWSAALALLVIVGAVGWSYETRMAAYLQLFAKRWEQRGRTSGLGQDHLRIRWRLMTYGLFWGLIGTLCLLRIFSIGAAETNMRTTATTDGQVPVRGEIVDRNGVGLARSFKTYALWFNPAVMGGSTALTRPPREVAEALVSIFPDMDADAITARLTAGKPGYLRRRILPEEANRINAIGEPALEFPRETDRIYPQGALASHVLGFVGADGIGRAGMEAALNRRLTDPQLRQQATTLSIDVRVQGALERELATGIAESQANGAAGIILDVDTGELVALASMPAFNPNRIDTTTQPNLFNRATNQVYEMGSTLKPITLAAAIDVGTVSDLNRRFPATALSIGGFFIRDSSPLRPSLSAAEGLLYSSNVVSARIGDELGSARLSSVLRAFGMNERPYVELPARGTPLWPRGDWGRLTTMTVSFGHGIAITPLHLASAYAAMVNGGVWRPTTLMKLEQGKVPSGRRVIKQTTSALMRQLLRFQVTDGTGRRADAAGWRIGGMTGSAEKPGPGGYSSNRLTATFAGAFPMDRPRYVVVVLLSEPQGTEASSYQRTAGWNAAPLAGRIIERTGLLLGVRPSNLLDADTSGVRAAIGPP